MKNIIGKKWTILMITTLLIFVSLSGFTNGSENEQPNDSKDYTHTVMVELGISGSCPYCPSANNFWQSTYDTGNYDFEFTVLHTGHSPANLYVHNHFNLYWVPSSYIDGFYSDQESTTVLDNAGDVEVYDIDAEFTKCNWLDTAEIDIEVEITNNEASTYDGFLRVYIVEKVSSFLIMNNGAPPNHAFLEFAIDETISIPASSSYHTTTIWDGSTSYPGLEIDNCQVILVVSNDEGVTDYSKPPSENPFTAYQVDETTAVDPNPNLTPTVGFSYLPAYPDVSELITFTDESLDSDGTIVSWDWDFGNGDSSTDQHPTYSYDEEGLYTVTLTVEDDDGATASYSDLVIVSDDDVLALQSITDRGFPIRHALDGDWAAAQSFMVNGGGIVSNVKLLLRKFGNPEFNLTVELREDSPEGNLLDWQIFTPAEVPSNWEWFTINFTDYYFADGVDVFVVVPPAPSGVTTSFGYEWSYTFGDQYADGAFWFTRDGGALWRDLPAVYDYTFCVFGY